MEHIITDKKKAVLVTSEELLLQYQTERENAECELMSLVDHVHDLFKDLIWSEPSSQTFAAEKSAIDTLFERVGKELKRNASTVPSELITMKCKLKNLLADKLHLQKRETEMIQVQDELLDFLHNTWLESVLSKAYRVHFFNTVNTA